MALFAQSSKQLKSYYQGKQFFENQRYEEAMPFFEMLMNSDKAAQLQVNSRYFYSLCLFHTGDLKQAEFNFLNLIAQVADLKLKDEINFYLADINFKNQDFEKALFYLGQIKNPELSKEVLQMKGFYINQMEIKQLRNIQQNYPADTTLAQMLIDKIAARSENEEEVNFMYRLTRKYGLKKPEKIKLKKNIFKKDTFKIASVFPFDIKRVLKKDTSTLSKVSMSLYQGMRLAKKELDSLSGLKIQLYAYDLPREKSDTLRQILQSGEFDDIDLVMLGPVNEEAYRDIAKFADDKKINLISPLSTDARLLQNEFTYLYESSPETQAHKTIEFAFANCFPKSTVIFYDNLPKNLTFAALLKEKAQKAGIQVLAFEEVKSFDTGILSSTLNRFASSDIGSVMIFSTSQMVAEDFLKTLKNINLILPVFAPDAWLNFQSIAFESYEEHQIHFVFPDYLDVYSKEAVKFKKAYVDFARNEPNIYGFIGYEMVNFFIRLFEECGTMTSFREVLSNRKATQGKFVDKIDYSEANDNQYVPILKIQNGEPVLASKK